MTKDSYQKLCETLAQRRGRYPGVDIPEFYALMEVLFTADEAEAYCAIPRGKHPASTIAEAMGRPEAEVIPILETMANNGLCSAGTVEGATLYWAMPLVPGIFEFQFMRGTSTERDHKLAKLIHAYKDAVDRMQGPTKVTFPTTRVIPVDKKIEAGNTIHTYDQVETLINNTDTISTATCFCRHSAVLRGEDIHGMPNDVCMAFGPIAQFQIDRLGAKKLSREEAMGVLNKCEEAGLVHMTQNVEEGVGFV